MTDHRRLETLVRRSVMAGAMGLWLAHAARAGDGAGRAQGFFSEFCVRCHDASAKKGGLDLAALPWKPDDLKKKERKTFRVLPDAVVIFDDNSPTVLRQWIVRTRGRYRIKVSAYAYQAAGRPVWPKLYHTDF
jgi:hypothetical protein